MGQGRLSDNDYTAQWPKALQKAHKNTRKQKYNLKPKLIVMSQPGAEKALDDLVENEHITEIIDNYEEQYAELVVSRHPQLYRASFEVKKESLKDYLKQHYNNKEPWQMGVWVYFPWSGVLTHMLDETLFLESRTIRNKNLMTAEEQEKYANFFVGCVGMSVGSNVALSLTLTGGSQKLKIADGAVISGSNLNRILANVSDIGASKTQVMARKLYEMNPFMAIERYDQDINEETIARFFDTPWPIQAVVDEIDDLKMKVLLRVEARKRGIPVIMATDLGDDVMLDVERFDLDSTLPLFHGLVPDIEKLLTRQVGKQEWLKYAMQIIDVANVSLRMQESLLDVGTKIVTQPQLGGTALMSGAVAAYAVRQIALDKTFRQKRTLIALEKQLNKDTTTLKHKRKLAKHSRQLRQALKAM